VKKVGDLFAELGFREDGSDSVKRAFIENLVKAAAGAPRSATPFKPAYVQAKAHAPVREEQLSFDFSEAEPETPFPLGVKRSAG
jgi:hypothetical protein